MTAIIVRALLAMAVTVTLAPIVLAVLRRRRVLDHPNERSSHEAPVPRGGGVAPAFGALTALALVPSLDGGDRLAVATVAGGFGLVGLLEDLVGIPALRRLALQVLAAGATCVLLLDDLSGPALWRAVFTLGVLFWVVGFVNAYNFMDGIDGISVAQALGAGATWVFVAWEAGGTTLAAGGAILVGAAVGFAPYNLPVARMFLGDVGSYFFGAWLAAVAVLGLRAGLPPEAVLAPLALYGADTGSTLVRRVIRGQRWYLPHRDHAYQRLIDSGWSHLQTSGLVLGCIAACGALGTVSLGSSLVARAMADVAIAAVISTYLLAPRWATRNASSVAVA